MGALIRQQITVYLDDQGRRGQEGHTRRPQGQAKVHQVVWSAYRDASGHRRRVPLSTDKVTARQMLAALEREAELVRRGVVTKAEAAVGQHQGTVLEQHINDYLAYLESKGTCNEHRSERRRQLRRIATECGFTRLADLEADGVGALADTTGSRRHVGADRNSYVVSVLAFANWCADDTVGRLLHNPLRGISKADEKADRRRERRAMTEDELVRLLAVARERPLQEAQTVRKGPRKGERYADVRPEVRERLTRLGWERALIYKTLVLTGLRKGELASLTVAQLNLNIANPFVQLRASDEKSREGNAIPLRGDLTDDLRDWLEDKLRRLRLTAKQLGQPLPARLPPETPVFDVPDKLCKILTRDLVAAGIVRRVKVDGKWRIDKCDDRGRTIDVHALRHTFGSLMSRGGVARCTAQAAMRHSKIELTMNVYTDPRLLDVRDALDVLPLLPLGSGQAAPLIEDAVGKTADAAVPTLNRNFQA